MSSQVDYGFEAASKKVFEPSELYSSAIQSPEQYDPPTKLKIKLIRCKVCWACPITWLEVEKVSRYFGERTNSKYFNF